MGATWIVIPTYDEAETIAALVAATAATLDSLGREWRILVVDDDSPDGTGAIVEDTARRDPRVEVLHRAGKEGLGRAYLAGFARALAGGAGVVVQMDADGSHDPAHLAGMFERLDAGADVVLGSRYVPGGGIEDWGPVRRGISRGGCVYARRVLGVGVQDLTGGFKVHRRHALEAIDLPSIRSEGYSFQIEMTLRALRAGLTVQEHPIVFRDRREGTSKMSWRIAIEATWLVPRLRAWRPDPTPAPPSVPGTASVTASVPPAPPAPVESGAR